MSFLSGLRIPVAIVFGLVLNAGMFYVLWSLTNVEFDIEVKEATHRIYPYAPRF